MAQGWTKPLTEMSTRSLPRDKERPKHKTDNLTAIFEPIEPERPVTRIALAFFFYTCFKNFLNDHSRIILLNGSI
jgi:hypothetical protein